uniref:hypothetical protein n=1 Tax=Nonomuraea sp. CA-251285 TaxID=3240002 RepID=UPI003F4982CE
MTENEAICWQVTITCRRPPRTPPYEDDTFFFQIDKMKEFFLSMHGVDDLELTFTARQVKLRFTHLASTRPRQRYEEGPLRLSMAKANEQAEYATRALAVVLSCARFEIEGGTGPDARLPGPVRVQLAELGRS